MFLENVKMTKYVTFFINMSPHLFFRKEIGNQ